MTSSKIEKRASRFELRANENGQPVLFGYAALFDMPSEDLGGFVEYIRKGAFTKCLASGPDVRLLVNHEGLPLARTISGTLQLVEDERGLAITAPLDPSDPDVAAVLPKIKRKDLTQMSFGFYTISDRWTYNDDSATRELLEVDLFDVAIVTFPAYPSTSVDVRALQRVGQRNANRAKLAKLLKSG